MTLTTFRGTTAPTQMNGLGAAAGDDGDLALGQISVVQENDLAL